MASMQHVIYIDVYFLINVFMDVIVLVLTGQLLKQKIRWWRIIIASATGGIGASVLFLQFHGKEGVGEFFSFVMSVLLAVCMVIIGYGIGSKKQLLYKCGCFLLVTYITSGILDYFYYHTNIWNQNSLIIWMFWIMCIVIGEKMLIDSFFKQYGKKKYFYEVTIKVENMMIHGIGYVDTGNHLTDCYSHKPVSIISQEMLTDEQKNKIIGGKRFRIIPFSSIGENAGSMQGFWADVMCLRQGKEVVIIEKPMIAIYNNTFKSKEKYNTLLHPDLIHNSKKEEKNAGATLEH